MVPIAGPGRGRGARKICPSGRGRLRARHRDTLDDIVVGTIFENVLVPRADGSRVLAYRSLHRGVAVDASPGA